MTFPVEPERRRYLELAAFSALAVLVLGLLSVRGGVGVVRVDSTDGGSFVDAVPGVWFVLSVPLSAAAPLLALRRPYVAALAALALPLGTLVFGVALVSAFLGALATSAVLLRRWTRVALAAAVLSLGLPAVLLAGGTMVAPDRSQIYMYDDRGASVLGLYAVAAALALAAGMGYRSWARSAGARARLETERAGVLNQAALVGERSRLARDLHDVVAHHVSLIAVRAETAPYTVEGLSPGARVVLAEIADDSRRALDELRDVLGILRRGEEGTDRAPQPSGSEVPELVERSRSAGEVALDGVEALEVLDSTRGYVAYRVVQEALTNARRHAPGAPVRVECRPAERGVRVRVSNLTDGEGPVRPGRGLTGMRERVEAVGGTLSVAVRGGDLVVEAVLPS